MPVKFALSVFTGFLEILCFGGLIFGWSSLSYVLRKENYFSATCSGHNTTSKTATGGDVCVEQEESLILVYTVATFALNFLTLFIGASLDKMGTFITRFAGVTTFTIGAILLITSDPQHSVILYPAFSFIAIGGISLLMVNIPLGNLFPKYRSTLIYLMNGGFDGSNAIPLLIKLAYDNGIALGTSFTFIASASVFCWMRSFFLMPMKLIPFKVPDDFKLGIDFSSWRCFSKNEKVKLNTSSTEGSDDESTSSDDNQKVENRKEGDIPLIECLKTLKFWTNTAFYSVILLRLNIFFATFGPWLIFASGGDESQFATYTNFFGMALFCGILCAPLNGICADKLIGFFKQKPDLTPTAINERVLSITQGITALIVIACSICTCISTPFFTYASFVLFILFKAFIFGGNSTYIALLFPSRHFGRLFGLVNLIASIFSLLQYPLGSLVLNNLQGDFVSFHIGLTIGCLVILIHPIYLYFKSRNP